jgi:hypothetical protein
MNWPNQLKFYLVDMQGVNGSRGSARKKTRERKMQDSLAMLLKTNGGKMSENGSLAMLMI